MLKRIKFKKSNYHPEVFIKTIEYRDSDYFICQWTEKHYKTGVYEFTTFKFNGNYGFNWKFRKNNKEVIASGNSLHCRNSFKSVEDIKVWIESQKNLLKLSNI